MNTFNRISLYEIESSIQGGKNKKTKGQLLECNQTAAACALFVYVYVCVWLV